MTETTTETAGKLATKIARIASQLQAVPKSGYNADQNYHFATDADIVEAARGPMNAANVAIFPSVLPSSIQTVTGLGRHGNMILTTLVVQFTVVDGDSGDTMVCNFPGSGTDTQDKGAYKAMTGAGKYFYQKLFNLPTSDAEPESVDRRQLHGDALASELPPAGETVPVTATPKPKPTPTPKPAAVAGPAGVSMVKAITVKKGTNAKGEWVLYKISFAHKLTADDGTVTDTASSFSDSVGMEADTAKEAGTPVRVVIHASTNARGFKEYTITEFSPA